MASRKGDKLRAYNQIKQLARNNEIVLCALNVDGNADKQKAFPCFNLIVSRLIS